jgi:RNA polymerase sigma-70 factor, ECF subfamily
VNVYNNLKGFRGDSSIGTWIYRITVNVCTNKLRQLQRQRRQMTDDVMQDEDGEQKSLTDNIQDSEEKKPDNVFSGEQKKELIYKRIRELPEEQKQVLVLRDIDDLSYDEIADVLKTSVSAVKSKLFRARENLRFRLKKDDILGE